MDKSDNNNTTNSTTNNIHNNLPIHEPINATSHDVYRTYNFAFAWNWSAAISLNDRVPEGECNKWFSSPPPRLTLFLSLLFLRISILLLGSHPVYILCLAKSSQVCALRGYDLRFTWIPSIIRIIFFFIYLFIYWWEPWHGFVDGMRVNIYDSSWVFKENIFPLSSLPFQILTMKIYNNYLWGIN